jgi:hypothetical protein
MDFNFNRCNVKRSVNIGVMTTIVMSIIMFLWIGHENIKRMNISFEHVLLFVAVLFVISTSMDRFNSCFTVCNKFSSSLTYGLFTATLIYAVVALFVQNIPLTNNNILMFLANIVVLACIHSLFCI